MTDTPTTQAAAVTQADCTWLPMMNMPIGDQRQMVVRVRGAQGEEEDAYFDGRAWKVAPVSDDAVDLPFEPVFHRLSAAPAGEGENDRLRAALIAMGRMLPGVLLADNVSTDFLTRLPDEMAHYHLQRATPQSPAGGEGDNLLAQIARVVVAFEELPGAEQDAVRRQLAILGCNPGVISAASPAGESRDRFLAAIHEATPTGQWIAVQHHPDGDWSVAKHPLPWLPGGEVASPSGESALREAARAEIINTPETADFMAGVPLEAAHQRERWGVSHDGGKTPFDWFWLIGYLAQKAAAAQVAGDDTKALHHTISTAAALANWHAQIAGRTDMRPGIGPDDGGEKPGSAYDLASALESAK